MGILCGIRFRLWNFCPPIIVSLKFFSTIYVKTVCIFPKFFQQQSCSVKHITHGAAVTQPRRNNVRQEAICSVQSGFFFVKKIKWHLTIALFIACLLSVGCVAVPKHVQFQNMKIHISLSSRAFCPVLKRNNCSISYGKKWETM